jgi:hypothetical protein
MKSFDKALFLKSHFTKKDLALVDSVISNCQKRIADYKIQCKHDLTGRKDLDDTSSFKKLFLGKRSKESQSQEEYDFKAKMQKTEPDKFELEEEQAQSGLFLVGLERQVKSQYKVELEEAQAQGGLFLVGLEGQVKSQFDELPDELP